MTDKRDRYLIIMRNELLHRLQRHCDAINRRMTWGFARGLSDIHRWFAVASISVSPNRIIGICQPTCCSKAFSVNEDACRHSYGQQNWSCKLASSLSSFFIKMTMNDQVPDDEKGQRKRRTLTHYVGNNYMCAHDGASRNNSLLSWNLICEFIPSIDQPSSMVSTC